MRGERWVCVRERSPKVKRGLTSDTFPMSHGLAFIPIMLEYFYDSPNNHQAIICLLKNGEKVLIL